MKVRLPLRGWSATVALLGLCGCSLHSLPSPQLSQSSAVPAPRKKVQQNVYWTLFADSGFPQVEIAQTPLTSQSGVSDIDNNSYNQLDYTSGMAVDASGNLWILCFGEYGGDPGTVRVFTPPLTATSQPIYSFILAGTSDPDHLTFDHQGNLWVNSHANNEVLEYLPPFTSSGTLNAALTLSQGLTNPAGVAVDAHGSVFVDVQATGSGTKSIAVFRNPASQKPPYYLNGLDGEGGLIFDKHGNLYASSDANPTAIVRYDRTNLRSGATPSIVDSTGLVDNVYESDFALSKKGDLYFANCGNTGSIYVYPTSTQAFSSSLAPTVDFRDTYLTDTGCGWGIAIH